MLSMARQRALGIATLSVVAAIQLQLGFLRGPVQSWWETIRCDSHPRSDSLRFLQNGECVVLKHVELEPAIVDAIRHSLRPCFPDEHVIDAVAPKHADDALAGRAGGRRSRRRKDLSNTEAAATALNEAIGSDKCRVIV
jgi:hypothetical protein